MKNLQEKLKKIPEEVELQLEGKKFIEKYDKFYDNDEKRFLEKTAEMFRNKGRYVKFLYYDSNLNALEDTKKELKKVTARKNHAPSIASWRDNACRWLPDFHIVHTAYY